MDDTGTAAIPRTMSREDRVEGEDVGTETADIAIIGGGAAGLAAAIFAARLMPTRSVLVLDGADRLGAKILVSGGGRCNVTNRTVTVADFSGGSPNVIKRVLAAFPAGRTVAFFREIGVDLYEEEDGKLFPITNQARTVLEALLREASHLGVSIRPRRRVAGIRRDAGGFRVAAGTGVISARHVLLATGGKSMPKTGSDGSGYALAEGLGHTLVPLTPALVSLILRGDSHAPLSGISHGVELSVRGPGIKPVCVRGTLLWTHFGVSGPAVLDVSRHWHRARLQGREAELCVNLMPGADVSAAEGNLRALAEAHPRTRLHNCLGGLLPARVAEAILHSLEVDGATTMAHLPKDVRRRLARALVCWPLPVQDSRGYAHAEATAGGVPLSEVDPHSLGSRKCRNLYFAGEILDVDGRIGGFNLQWAWASAWVAGTAMAQAADMGNPPVA